MKKKYKNYKKSMRVLIAVLISLICINGVMMVGTLIASATVTPAASLQETTNDFAAKKVSEMQIAKFEAKVATATTNTQETTALTEAPTTTATQPAVTTTKTATTTTKAKTTTKATTAPAPAVTAPAPAPAVTAPAPAVTAPAPTTTTPSASDISTLKNSVTPALVSAFDQLAFSIVINPSATHLGYFSTSKHSIEMRSVSVTTFRHEMGHFLDVLKNMPSRGTDFAGIYAREKGLYTGTNGAYITSTAQEYFAQSYRNYLENPSQLQAERPETFAFIDAQVTSISSADISRTYSQYSWSW